MGNQPGGEGGGPVDLNDPAAVAAVFQRFDTSGDGEIDRGEFALAAKELLPDATDKEIEGLFTAADADGSGEVDLEEFRAAVSSWEASGFFSGISLNPFSGNDNTPDLSPARVNNVFARFAGSVEGELSMADFALAAKVSTS